MNSSNSLKKAFIDEIERSSYKVMKNRVIYLLKYELISNFIDNKKSVEIISEIIETIIEKIIRKVIQNFGSISNIVRYCLTNFFKINQEFTSDEFYEVIEMNFYYYDKTTYSKYLNNEISKLIESVKDKRKVYFVKDINEKYFHI